EKGMLKLRRNNITEQWLEIHPFGEKMRKICYEPEKSGLKLEAIEVMSCLDKGLIESDIMNFKLSERIVKILDFIKYQTGIRY
ncbi:MAG: hypothetical protein LWW85_11950, partial [Marinilabiliales bacterium]|nr:hypothetical protein [Marinilabiliales bacterium]